MNVLFLTIGRINSINDGTIYSDLLKAFVSKGHNVYAVTPNERKYKKGTEFYENGSFNLLKVKTFNLQKCNIIEKGISTVLIESQYKRAIKKFFGDISFGLVIYSTPPITLANVIRFVKKRDGAKSYLMLKDIFPQNAVDMGMMGKRGLKGLLYRYFRSKEKKLYILSDRIGCMSEANVDYVLEHNPYLPRERVEICPNSIEVRTLRLDSSDRDEIRKKYGIPTDKTVFVYGGNLGKPQGIPFIIRCLEKEKNNENAFFLIVGDGTEYGKLEAYIKENALQNTLLMKSLHKDDYDVMTASCDVGLIFLDHRFTIPNFPSRLLSYMQAGIPVLACTDTNTDIGKVITDGGFGWWCESNSVESFSNAVKRAIASDLTDMGNNGFDYLNTHYNVDAQCEIIISSLKKQ